MPDTALRRARISVSAVFMIHAAAFGTWGTRIPAIKHHVGIGNGQLGIAFSGLAIGLVVGTRVAGGVVDRFGSRPAIRVAIVVLCAVLIGPALADTLAALTAALFVLGAIGGFLDVAMNAHTVVVERGYGRPIMSSVHALWSVGLLIGALTGAGAEALGLDPRASQPTPSLCVIGYHYASCSTQGQEGIGVWLAGAQSARPYTARAASGVT